MFLQTRNKNTHVSEAIPGWTGTFGPGLNRGTNGVDLYVTVT